MVVRTYCQGVGALLCSVRPLVLNPGEVMRKGARESHGPGDLLVLGSPRGGTGAHGGSK